MGKLFLLLAIFFISCTNVDKQLISSTTLFNLNIGNADTDLSFFQANKNFNMANFHIEMKDGLIFISNTATNKIIEFNSYGNLLSSIYDANKNPKPVLLEEFQNQSQHQAFIYPFNKIGKFTLNTEKELLIVDKIPEQSKSYSKEHNAILTDKVLVFNKFGSLKYTIGQEGVNGKPFPAITSIECDQKDNIIIISKNSNGCFFYKYDNEGSLLLKTTLLNKDFSKKDSVAISVIGNVNTTKNNNIILVKVDEFNLQQQRKIEFSRTKIFQYYIKEKKIKDYITLPENNTTIQSDNKLTSSVYQTIFDYLGKNKNGNAFYLAPDSNESYKLIIQKDKNLIYKKINFNFQDHIYAKMNVSPEGIIIGAILFKDRIELVWWRTDV